MKKIFLLPLMLLVTAGMLLTSCGKAQYTVGICQQMPHKALDSATQGFKDALEAELGTGNVLFLEQNAQGESTSCTSIINNFVNRNVDLILANATTALQAAVNGTTTIPILGTSVTDYGTVLGIENFDGLTGTNVSGSSDLTPLDQQAQMILDLYPNTKTVGLLYCSAEPNSDYQVKGIRTYLEQAGITCTDYPFFDSNEIAAVAQACAAASDVIYIPTDNTAASSAEAIGGAILHTSVPVLGGDEGICSSCGIATICIDYYQLGEMTGRMAAEILTGEAVVEAIPVAYAPEYLRLYNPDLCEEFGVDISLLESLGYSPIGD